MSLLAQSYRYCWRHPSGDMSAGFVSGKHRTLRSAKRAVVRQLKGMAWPQPQGAYRPPWSDNQIVEGTLKIERA